MKIVPSILYFLIILLSFSTFHCSYGLPSEESLFLEKLIDMNPNLQNLSIPTDDTVCNLILGNMHYSYVKVECTSNSISNMELSKVKLPEEIGKLAHLDYLTVIGLIGELPQSLTRITVLKFTSIEPVALPSNMCSLKTLNVSAELLYLPKCLSSTLETITLNQDQPYFFSMSNFAQTNMSITLSNMRVPALSKWLSFSPPKTTSAVTNNIEISTCTFQSDITSQDFELLNKFKNVHISNTNLTLPTEVNLTMSSLFITDSNLTTFPNFNTCPNLSYFYLTNNKIRNLPIDVNCPFLNTIDFSYNALTAVPNWNLPSLQVLYLNNNNISTFPDTLWKLMNNSARPEVYLEFNNIQDFPSYFTTTNWHPSYLSISNNPINVGPNGDGPDFLTNSSSNFITDSLSIQNIGLTSVSVTMLQRLAGSLSYLDISYNSIQTLPDEIFNMPLLLILISSNNLITSIPNINSGISNFDISSNRITDFDDILFSYSYRYLDISHNPISTWNIHGSTATGIRDLYMKNTRLSTIPSIVLDSTTIQTLDLSDNPQLKIFDGSLFQSQIIMSLNLNNISLTKFIPLQYSTKLQTLNLANNPQLFDTVSNTDNAALNIQAINDMTLGYTFTLILSNTGLTDMITFTNSDASNLVLDLSYNRITTFKTGNFSYNSLNLSHNSISSFQILSNSATYYNLDLSYNSITSFPGKDNIIESYYLNLSGNPLDICNTPFVYNSIYLPSHPADDLDLSSWYTSPTLYLRISNMSIPNQSNTCGCVLPNLKYIMATDLQVPYCIITPCQGKPPTPISYCNGTFWIIPQVINPTTPIVISGPTIIQGNLSLSSTSSGIEFEGTSHSITVQGCFESQQPVVINLSDEDIDKLSKLSDLEKKKYMLVKAFGGRCSTDSTTSLPKLQIRTSGNSKSCIKVDGKFVEDAEQDQNGHSLSGVFNVSTLKCKVWWIVLISVLGGLLIIALIVLIVLYLKVKRFRHFISPYSQKRNTIQN